MECRVVSLKTCDTFLTRNSGFFIRLVLTRVEFRVFFEHTQQGKQTGPIAQRTEHSPSKRRIPVRVRVGLLARLVLMGGSARPDQLSSLTLSRLITAGVEHTWVHTRRTWFDSMVSRFTEGSARKEVAWWSLSRMVSSGNLWVSGGMVDADATGVWRRCAVAPRAA